MINLICFPHYTCGGLLSDIFNNSYSDVVDGGLHSFKHQMGKLGDSNSVLVDYNVDQMMQLLESHNPPLGTWAGTHCWPGVLPLDKFNKIIVVSTSTFRSKIYLLILAYNHYFSQTCVNLVGTELIDKIRETAKNYTIPFNPVFAPNVINLEFADVVNETQEFYAVTGHLDTTTHMNRWKNINNFLYDPNLWSSQLVDAFYQAEFEINLKRYYRYN